MQQQAENAKMAMRQNSCLGVRRNGHHSRPRVQLKGGLQLSAFYDQQLPTVSSQYHPFPFPFRQPAVGHVVLRLPFGQGTGQQLQTVLGGLEALEDAAADDTDDAVAFACCSRVEHTLQTRYVI